jgi:hypothetical protein
MADLDADAIVIAGTATLYVAPAGTTMPASLSASLNAAFVELGYSTEDGVKFTDSKTVQGVRPHQSFYEVRRFVTERASSVEFSLLQWDADTVPLAFGGGSITSPAAGEYRYTPPDPEDIDERAVVIDITDGDRHFRIGIPKAMVSSSVESTFARTGPAMLPITLDVLGTDGTAPWVIDSDDAAWNGSGS